MMQNIGFIGIGNMGIGMAANLAKFGHRVRVFDLSKDAIARAVEQGCTASDSVKSAVENADIVITMLPAGAHVLAVYGDEGGVFNHAKSGALLIDCSTIDVETARKVSKLASDKSFEMLDAPVSGGTIGAAQGTLTFMCGGSDNTFNRSKQVLEIIGENIFHAGASGNGQAAKICNNIAAGYLHDWHEARRLIWPKNLA